MARNTYNGMSMNPSRGRNRRNNPYGFNRDSDRPDNRNTFETDLRGVGEGRISSNPYDRADEEFMDEDELYLAQDFDFRDSERYRDIGSDRPRRENYGKGPKGWTRSDERIREDVSDALYLSYDVDAQDIEVEVDRGLVTLRGSVENRDMKWAAEDAVENVSGVIDVQNLLDVSNLGQVEHKRRMSRPEDEKGTRLG